MNSQITFSNPIAVNIDPITGHKTEFYTLNAFVEACIDRNSFKIKPETYIHPEYMDYDCDGCSVIPYVNPKDLSEVVGYTISGNVKKFDTDKNPHELLDSKKVAWVVGATGVFASNTNKANIQYVLGTDNLELFLKIANAGDAIVFHKDIDQAYWIINDGMPETIFRAMTGFNEPEQNQDLFIKLDDSFYMLKSKQINSFFLSEINHLKRKIDTNTFMPDSIIQWGELIPLEHKIVQVQASYPIHAFPLIPQQAIKQVSYYNHVPVALAGQTALGVMVYVTQEHAQAPSDKTIKGQPCSFGVLTIFESGGGKDETRNLLASSIEQRENNAIKQYMTDKNAYSSLPLKERRNEHEPINPITLYKKGTTQGIVKAMSRSVFSSFAWQTTEGAMVLGGYSFNTETIGESLGVVNSLIDKGTSSNTLYGNEEPEIVIGKRFSVDLSIQDVMAKKALNNETLKLQGFLARFFVAAPEPLPVNRITKEQRLIKPSEDAAIIAFNELSERLKYPAHKENSLTTDERIHFLKDEEAETLHVEFENYIKKEANKTKNYCGKYYSIRPNALRMIQYSLRVATVLAYFTPELDYIDAKTMQGAIDLCTYSLDEWIRYYNKDEDEETDSDLMLKWLLKQGTEKVLKSSISTHVTPKKLRNKNTRDDILKTLCDGNYVKIEKISGKEYVVINPVLL
ncbi:TPA: DUF3987 domain-containing protein [Acinetobacter baumannii]|uniref:DUF3987 domain-containing protein n=1 Tax=Acinetobacter baumannii TaxID=470 RepID=UPI00069072C5|nr:DUF3987 domain-containing protein [Acinetobacter baumannii]KQF00015.1 hypothetical protein APB97_10180 [Acinetobacter baumannii]MBD0438289.1 DUF3987 domain-containing protein [Acinetobacter baumannii]MBP4978781.1 DUF3987 domain-containing protein [Acinetobacter baumannii]QJP37497.1 DUF3987 domain-containing protein [Acinetobacter baumannii]TDH87161.1 DUF3987 domain-containing protein [Acinetobacter baumannii]